MNIEVMKQALEAIEDLRGYRPDIDKAIETLRTAISQQPATGEPVYQICKKDSQSISSAWIDVEKQAYEDAGIYPEYGRRTLYTHPAPSVPADVVRDAERYRFIRDADVSDDLIPDIALYAMESLDEYIDAAMLAAKEK